MQLQRYGRTSEDRQSLGGHRTQDNRKATHYTGSQQMQRILRAVLKQLTDPRCLATLQVTQQAAPPASCATLSQNANIWLLASNLYRSRASSKTE